jgi:hypothetical protein
VTWRDDVLASSPVVYYEFEETSGVVADDSGPNGYDGTISAAVLVNQTGAHGKGFDFTSGASSVSVTAPPYVWPTAQLMIECWAKQASNAGNPRLWEADPSIVNPAFGIVTNTFIWLSLKSTGAGNTSLTWNHAGEPTDGAFHLYQFVFDGTDIQIWFDGVFKAGTPLLGSTTLDWAGYGLTVGNRTPNVDSGDSWHGVIDDFAVYPSSIKAPARAGYWGIELSHVTSPPALTFVGSTDSHGVSTGAKTRVFGTGPIAGLQTGDLLIAAISNGAIANEVDPITAPDAGWTRIRRDLSVTNTRLSTQLWYKIATGPSDGGGTWTFGTVAGCAEIVVMDIVAYRTTGSAWTLGNHGANVTEVTISGAGNTGDIVAPSVTASGAFGHLLFCNFVTWTGGTALFTTLTLPGSLTQRYNQATNATQEANGDDRTVAASAPSGTRTAVVTIIGIGSSTDQIGQSVIFGSDSQ